MNFWKTTSWGKKHTSAKQFNHVRGGLSPALGRKWDENVVWLIVRMYTCLFQLVYAEDLKRNPLPIASDRYFLMENRNVYYKRCIGASISFLCDDCIHCSMLIDAYLMYKNCFNLQSCTIIYTIIYNYVLQIRFHCMPTSYWIIESIKYSLLHIRISIII